MAFPNILATLIFAMTDFIFLEIIAYVISIRSKRHAERFIFGVMAFSLIFFYANSLLQGTAVAFLSQLNIFILILILAVLFCFSILFLAKFTLNKKWKYRLVFYPLIFLVLLLIILWIIYYYA